MVLSSLGDDQGYLESLKTRNNNFLNF
jgi:hypothetical protein